VGDLFTLGSVLKMTAGGAIFWPLVFKVPEASFLNGFLHLRAKLAPTRKVGAYAQSWRLRAKLVPRAKLAPTREVGAYATVAFSLVGAYARSWRLRAKLAPTHEVGAYA
jgi:hypothetical protein